MTDVVRLKSDGSDVNVSWVSPDEQRALGYEESKIVDDLYLIELPGTSLEGTPDEIRRLITEIDVLMLAATP